MCHSVVVRIALVVGLAGVPIALPAAAPAEDAGRSGSIADVEKALAAKCKELHVAGAALVIVQDDKVACTTLSGLRDVRRRLPVTPDTLFAIGSCTKAFTGMAVMMSVDEGKLALSDHPRKHIPYFRLHDPDADKRVTLLDLLCHRSGLPRTDLGWGMGDLQPRDVIRMAGEAEPTAKLGERYQYQNVMFLAAGEAVAAAQRTSWHRFVARRILRPLGMRLTSTSARATQRARDHAVGYSYNGERKRYQRLPMKDLYDIAPAGAINSCARDMAQWLRLMLGGGAFEGKRLVSEAGFAELVKPHMRMGARNAYGLGWALGEWEGHPTVAHGGGIDGFTAYVALMPDRKLGFALLTNANGTPLPGVMDAVIWRNLVGAPPKPAEPGTAAAVTTSEPPADPAPEVGSYVLPGPNVTFTVSLKEGRLVLAVPGQPEYPLRNLGGRRYALTPIEGFFATFSPAKDNPQETVLFVEQPQGNIVLRRKKDAPYAAPIAVDELIAKATAAVGGEANLRKHRSLVRRVAVRFVNEGATGDAVSYAGAPNRVAETLTLYGAGKKLGRVREYCDGTRAGTEMSYSAPTIHTGDRLADALNDADFYAPLSWKSIYPSTTITGTEKVADEECFVVRKVPAKGSAVTEWYSTTTFLLRKRHDGNGAVATLSDYRPVDGVRLPFRWEVAAPGRYEGATVFTVQDARFNVRIPGSTFGPKVAHPTGGTERR